MRTLAILVVTAVAMATANGADWYLLHAGSGPTNEAIAQGDITVVDVRVRRGDNPAMATYIDAGHPTPPR